MKYYSKDRQIYCRTSLGLDLFWGTLKLLEWKNYLYVGGKWISILMPLLIQMIKESIPNKTEIKDNNSLKQDSMVFLLPIFEDVLNQTKYNCTNIYKNV